MKYFKKSALVLLCCCLSANLAAQMSVIDSLEQVLSTVKLKNQEKTDILLQLSHAYLHVDTAKCRAYSMEALQLAQNSGLKMAEGSAYIRLGNFYSVNHFHYQSHASYVKAEKIFLELDEKDRLYALYRNMVITFNNAKEYDNLAYYANKVLIMATERKDFYEMIVAQMMLGSARFQDKKNQEALDYFLNLHQKALRLEDSLGLKRLLSSSLGNVCATIYFGTNRPREALPYFHQLRRYYEINNFNIHLGRQYGRLAQVHAAMHNIDSAEYYIRKAMDSNQPVNFIDKVYLASAKVDSLKGDYLSALANFQKYHYLTDSVSKDEKSTEMARLKVWYEFDQKEIEKRILNQEFQKQRKLTFILAVSLLMTLTMLALAVFFYRKITEMNREMKVKNHEMKELHTVKDKLFSVVAHDLRSPVAALASLIRLVDVNRLNAIEQELFKGISGRVETTSDLLGNLLNWAKSQMQGIVPAPVYFDIHEESRSVTDSLQTTADNKKIVLQNRIVQQQVYADRDMYALTLRNLSTNAIKYTSAGGEVILASELSGNMLVISVKDTGTGMPQEVQKKLFNLSETKSRRGTDNESGTGLGLVLCADFVKANGGRIWFTSVQGEGSTFFFSVPVNKL